MTILDKNYLRFQFRDRIYRSNGSEFQSFFEEVMRKAFSDFKKIKPSGKEGDGGNDGYVPSKGIYYQVYAPIKPEESDSDAASKLKKDFEKNFKKEKKNFKKEFKKSFKKDFKKNK